METKFKSGFTTLEVSNFDGLTTIKISNRMVGETKTMEISLGKSHIDKVINTLKKLNE